MRTFTSLNASGIPPDRLKRILADYIALEEAQIFRRLVMRRCGLLSLLAAVLASITHAFSGAIWALIITLPLAVPALAWIAEARIELRLGRALNDIPDHEKGTKRS
jgi:hypothetical protein